jgi:ribosome-binding protein aMBF1 (putative translation factor)
MTVEGKQYVLLARSEYERLTAIARVAEMPPLPKPDRSGRLPAVAYARASIAREIVARRARAGMTQRELAQRAQVRVETLCRIETGKHTASTATIAKLEHALAHFEKGRAPRRA